MSRRFEDRAEAGRLLAEHLLKLHLPQPIVVLALPRGGVPVGALVAQALGAPLDLLLVRKIGAPWQPEYALAAVAEGDPPEIFVDPDLKRGGDVDMNYVNAQAKTELHEIARRRQAYLRGRAPLDVKGRTAIVVDDGIATGATMRAALKALRRREPALLVLAVPVAPQDTLDAMHGEVDRIVCLAQPYPFIAVGQHYVEFDQVSDAQVIQALDSARQPEH